jgi:hypothetical protein
LTADRSLRRALLVACLACAAAIAPAARAQTAADVALARDLFREASQLSQKGDWEGARRGFERSLDLKHAAITLYSLGVAEKHTGKLVEALEHFRAFLAEPSTPQTSAFEAPARAAIAELAPRAAHLSFKVAPAGVDASVTVDGALVPAIALDRPRLVNPGAHVVRATAKGYRASEAKVDVAEGGSATATLRLELAPAAAEAPPVIAASPPSAPLRTRPDRTIPLVIVGAGGAVFVGGLVVGLLGVSQASSAPTKDGPEASAARTKGLIGDVVGGTGLAAIAVGGVLLLLGKPTKTDSARGLTPWASGSVAGAQLTF